MWDLPGPGLEPVSRALAGEFLTTAPLGKSLESVLINYIPRKVYILSFQMYLHGAEKNTQCENSLCLQLELT